MAKLMVKFREFLDHQGIDIALLLQRVIFGGLMIKLHGLTKLVHFEGWVTEYPDPLGIGHAGSLAVSIVTQVFGAVLLVLGIQVRVMSFFLAATMLTAAVVVKAGSTLMQRELAILYCFAYLVSFLAGGGRFTLDQLYASKFKRKSAS